jgi:hypothetical protein
MKLEVFRTFILWFLGCAFRFLERLFLDEFGRNWTELNGFRLPMKVFSFRCWHWQFLRLSHWAGGNGSIDPCFGDSLISINYKTFIYGNTFHGMVMNGKIEGKVIEGRSRGGAASPNLHGEVTGFKYCDKRSL